MRIGVLEWASAGGGSIGAWRRGVDGSTSVSLPASIIEEGWAMTRATIDSLISAGHDVAACLLPELVARFELSQSHTLSPINVALPIKRQWQACYGPCDATIVIAPESDGVLEELIKWCRRRGVATCNAQPEFIRRATDKWNCSVRWRECGLPHPTTRRMDHISPQWLAVAADQVRSTAIGEPLFVVKPRDGVGCVGIRRLTQRDVLAMAQKLKKQGTSSSWLVQPWHEGLACSRAAIVDRAGGKQWLPVTRQRLNVGEQVAYCGSRIEADSWQAEPEVERCLNAALDALGAGASGWIGVDFLYHPKTNSMTLIEVNPRLTTSFVELNRVVDGSLAGKVVAACLSFNRGATPRA